MRVPRSGVRPVASVTAVGTSAAGRARPAGHGLWERAAGGLTAEDEVGELVLLERTAGTG